MAYTEADAAALRSAIARGARRLKMNGEEVEYRDLAEMRSILSEIEASLAGQPTSEVSITYPSMGRGL